MPGDYGPSYQDYLRYGQDHGATQEGEGGPMVFRPAYTEEEWNAMSPYERHRATPYAGLNTLTYDVDEDDPLYQQFYERFGHNEDIENSGFELNNQQQTGLAIGYFEEGSNGVAGPQYGRVDWNQLAIDPERILWLDPPGTPGRRYLYERSNARAEPVIQEQARIDDSGLGDNFPLIAAAIVLGGGALANMGFIPGVEAGWSGLGGVPGVPGAAEAATGIIEGAAAPAAAPTAGLETYAGMTTGLDGEALALAPSTGVEGAAGVVDAAAGATPAGGGNVFSRAWDAYSGLSPAARQLIGGAVSTGASAALAQRRQNELIAQREREREQDRQDTIRRHRVPRYTTTYTPKPLPGGLISGNQGGNT